MPAEYIVVERSARKKLLKLSTKIHIRVISALDMIQANPLIGEKFHGELSEYYKFRIGDYRIIYSFDSRKSIVFILKIEHRQGVYK